jgi:membrane-associated phospholipid phosphatase
MFNKFVKTVILISLLFFSSFAVTGDKTKTEKTGDIIQLVIPLTGLGYSLATQDYNGTWQFTKTYLSTVVLTQALKVTVGEERSTQLEGERGRTFPSGHTSSAFAGASFIQKRYGWEAGAPAYMLAAFVGYSRVHAKKHNILDVCAAAVIGTAFGYYFTDEYIENEKYELSLDVDSKNIYVGVSFGF